MSGSDKAEIGAGHERPFDQAAKPPQRSYLLKLAGDLTIAAGIASLANGIYSVVTNNAVSFATKSIVTGETVCGFVVIVFGIISIAGGISVYKGMHFSLGLAGAVLGMIGGGLVGFWLGLFALVLYALSHEDL